VDMILEIYELIPKHENNFFLKKVIDQVYKVLDINDIDTSYELSLKS